MDEATAPSLAELEGRLVLELGPSVPASVVHRCVEEAASRFAAAPIQTYVPLLVERRVRRSLHDRRDEVRRPVPPDPAPQERTGLPAGHVRGGPR